MTTPCSRAFAANNRDVGPGIGSAIAAYADGGPMYVTYSGSMMSRAPRPAASSISRNARATFSSFETPTCICTAATRMTAPSASRRSAYQPST